MAHEQGNVPGMDPNRFGLKYDQGKARWELVPFFQITRIVDVFNFFITHKDDSYKMIITTFDRDKIVNEIMKRISDWRIGMLYDHEFHNLAIAAFLMLYLVRGKEYNIDEIKRFTGTRWDLINLKDLEGVIEVYSYGAKLYEDNNWMRVNPERYFGALLRHVKAIQSKDIFDTQSGMLHIYHAIWNCISLLFFDSEEERKSIIKNDVVIPDIILNTAKKMKKSNINHFLIKPKLIRNKNGRFKK